MYGRVWGIGKTEDWVFPQARRRQEERQTARESEHVGSYNDSSLQQPAKDEGRWQGAAKGGRVG